MEGGEERKKGFAERSLWAAQLHEAQASWPWIHGALSLLSPFVRLLRRLATAAGPCGHGLLCGNEGCRPLPGQSHMSRTAPSMLLQSARIQPAAFPLFQLYTVSLFSSLASAKQGSFFDQVPLPCASSGLTSCCPGAKFRAYRCSPGTLQRMTNAGMESMRAAVKSRRLFWEVSC